MLDKLEKIKQELNKAIEQNGLNSEKVKKITKKFDEALNKYYKKEKQYNKDNNMYLEYKKTIKELTEITTNFNKFPTIAEWNKYAKEKGLLNSESIKYISGLNWHELRSRIYIKKN